MCWPGCGVLQSAGRVCVRRTSLCYCCGCSEGSRRAGSVRAAPCAVRPGHAGLTAELRIRVSSLYVARSDAGRAVDDLSGQPLLAPRPGQPVVEVTHVDWHHRQVFKGGGVEAA